MRRAVTAVVAGVGLTVAAGIGVAAAAGSDGPAGRIADALAGLVSNGTISQDQADAVQKALTDAEEKAQQEREKEWAERQAEREQEWAEQKAELDAMLTRTIGKTSDEVRQELADGKTLKEIAGDKADELVDAAVALVTERTAAAVKDGDLTQEQADAIVSRAEETAKAWLAGDDTAMRGGLGFLLGMGGMGMGHGMGGPGFGGMGHGRGPGGFGDGDDGSEETPAPSSSDASLTT